MKIALTADWLVTIAGAERVLMQLHRLYPDAPIFTSVARPHVLGTLQNADIRCSKLEHWYLLLGRHQWLLPWMPRAMESHDLRGYDVILSSSHAVAKGILPPKNALHLCYCHTPMRYAWEMEEQYLEDFKIPSRLRPYIRRQLSKIRRWDMTTAKRVDIFFANSSTTKERIARMYNRDSMIIPPPVHERFFSVPLAKKDSTQEYYLAVGRFVPYKRFDMLITLANDQKLPLWIVGDGQDSARLRKMAGPTVRFLGKVNDDELPLLYANAKALLFPQHEDAGIVLLEAHACGTPVIAFQAGGALDAMVEGKTGVFFLEQTPHSLHGAIKVFANRQWERESIRIHAAQYSAERFCNRIQAEIVAALGNRQTRLYHSDCEARSTLP